MSAPFQGFCGPSYQADDRYASIERTINFFLEPNEAKREESKYDFRLRACPANGYYGQLPVPAPFNQPARALLEYRGTVYGVNGTTVFWLDSAGIYHYIGTVGNDGHPATLIGSGSNQIAVISAQQLSVINTLNNTLTPVPASAAGFLGATLGTFQDGYLIVLTPGSNQFQISGTDNVPTGDWTQWDPSNVAIMTGQADLLNSLISSREYLRLMGTKRSQIFVNVGPNGQGGFPFASYNSTFIETGSAAPWALVDSGVSLIWLCQDQRGLHTCWEDPAFQPRRISTFAVEQAWSSYATISDAVAFCYIWRGHLIYRITFPTADATWEYDKTTSDLIGRPIWTERNFTDYQGNQHCRPEQFYCYGYGENLVSSAGGDGNPGAVYCYSDEVLEDCAQNGAGQQVTLPLVRDRICPHQWSENKRIIYDRIEFECIRGVGLTGNPPVGTNPQIQLRWSNDAGNTWGPWFNVPVGAIGQYTTRALLNRCGYARDRVFWVRCSDPVIWGFVAAMLDVRVCGS